MDVERGHKHQHGKEHADKADENGGALRVDDKKHARNSDDGARPPLGHDVVVAQSVEDRDVAVHRDGQQTPNGGQQ